MVLEHICDSLITFAGTKIAVSGLGAVLTIIFGSNLPVLIALVSLIALDLITGVAKAIKQDNFTSKGMRAGVGKLIAYSILMCVAHQVGIHLGIKIFESMIYIYLIFTEYQSISENTAVLGIPLPGLQKIKTLYKKWKD
jgi:polar amino acid transport system substrate-binding protein